MITEKRTSSPNLYGKAKSLIPGGNMLLSKRPEMFLPDLWPSYFSKTNGCKVWCINGNEYTDMLMTPGTNILGYNYPSVSEAVAKVVQDGNMSSLNAPEEVELAEKLVELHPWADMVRFARSGGEANALAIRIARAASGRDNIAICGYHGWHDWYLATNLSDGVGLDNHLLPGLKPKGVPKILQGTVIPFHYNDLNHLEDILKNRSVGVIKMEVFRNVLPENDFLQKVRQLANEYGAVLIFDECTSGFRKTYGGLHKFYNVEPDMAMFGKALGNGFAVTSVIGRKEVMEAAQTTFISSTFWTERIGSVAGISTLDAMQKEKSWELITQSGGYFQQKLSNLSQEYGVSLQISGLEALTTFSFNSERSLIYKTYLTQEMLKSGYLASTSFYPSICHTEEILNSYFEALEPVFQKIGECEEERSCCDLLEGPVCHDGFKRLN